MIDIDCIYRKWYEEGSELWNMLRVHSELVGRKALECAGRRGLEVDRDFVWEASLLHDIGIVTTDAPGIHCHGTEPYIRHGVEGSAMLRGLGLPRHALVCERHTGAGLTVEDIVARNLPLPRRDMTPQSLEEKLICYADKFFSKSGDYRSEKPLERVVASMAKFGPDSLARFEELHRMFG